MTCCAVCVVTCVFRWESNFASHVLVLFRVFLRFCQKKKEEQITVVFAVRGKTWAKSIRLTTAVDFGLLTTQTRLWWKCLKACILVHTHTCQSLKMHRVLFVCFLQGYCSLTALKVSGCRTAFPISPRSLREATFTPPLAKSTARLLSVWPTGMSNSRI